MKELEVVTSATPSDTAAVPCVGPESRIKRYGRFWAVYDLAGQLVCVTVYKKGALEIVRRLRVQSR